MSTQIVYSAHGPEIGRSRPEDGYARAAINAVLAIPAAFGRWLSRRYTHSLLAALDDRQLRDIGLSREQLSKF